jgi:hypothetical protein
MMLLLPRNVTANPVHGRMRHRENAIASLPAELARHQVLLVDPMRRGSLKQMQGLFDAQVGWKIDQRVHVLGFHKIDLEVDSFSGRVLLKPRGQPDGSIPSEQRLAINRCPD